MDGGKPAASVKKTPVDSIQTKKNDPVALLIAGLVAAGLSYFIYKEQGK
jgi:hypothetical protein